VRIAVEHVLRAHAFMRTEAPPETWQPEADDESFFRVLGEIIAAGLARGNELADLTLSFSNMVVEDSAAGSMPVGEHVAMTVRGAGDWSPEGTWARGRGASPSPFVSSELEAAVEASDAVFGYTRQTGPTGGSITVLFARATPSTAGRARSPG
jgi:hypothetical protein